MSTGQMSGVEKRHKATIAIELLEDAADMYKSKRFYSAINLAGASSEVLCRLCEFVGLESPHQELREMLQDFYDADNDFFDVPKNGITHFYWAKNAIKHIENLDDQMVIIHPKMRASLYINQAAKAATELGIKHKIKVEFSNAS